MRITFVCPIADLSGGFRVIAVYAKLLRERGHDVTVVSRPPRKPTVRERLRAAQIVMRWSEDVQHPQPATCSLRQGCATSSRKLLASGNRGSA